MRTQTFCCCSPSLGGSADPAPPLVPSAQTGGVFLVTCCPAHWLLSFVVSILLMSPSSVLLILVILFWVVSFH